MSLTVDQLIESYPECAFFALYAGLRMYKDLKVKEDDSRNDGSFSIAGAEAYSMLKMLEENYTDMFIEAQIEYIKVYE